jgi:predicted aspartyl protease
MYGVRVGRTFLLVACAVGSIAGSAMAQRQPVIPLAPERSMQRPAPPPQRTPPVDVVVATPPAPLSLPLTVDRTTRLTLPVRIAGRGPYQFVVDTGAERTVLSTELATQLQLPATGRARVIAMTGAVEAPLVSPGPLNLEHMTLATGEVPTFGYAHLGAQGLIGIDSLQNHRLIIDFVRGTVDLRESTRLTPRALPDFDRDAIVVTARRKDGRLILSNATIGGRRVNIVIDTGAQASIGNRALQRMVAGQASQRHRTLTPAELLSVTGGTMTVERSVISRIVINGVDFTNLPVAYGDSPAFTELDLDNRPALLLGMDALSLFDRVSIDFANRRVVFDLPDGAQAPVTSRLAGWPRNTGG